MYPPSKLKTSSSGLRREWSGFELRTVAALICKGVHRHRDNPIEFSSQLNHAVNGITVRAARFDIGVEDVEDLLRYIFRYKRAAISFIERQPMARLTRSQLRVFGRVGLDFDGSKFEWQVNGRRQRKMPSTSNTI